MEIGDEDLRVLVEYEIDPGQRARGWGHHEGCLPEISPRLDVIDVRLVSGESAAREWAALPEQEREDLKDRLMLWAGEEEEDWARAYEEEKEEARAYDEDK